MATITNFQVDVYVSGIAGTYGPLTRVTDLSTLPSPNENIALEFTDNLGNTTFMSYEQLTTTNVRNRILGQTGGITERVEELKTAVAAVYAVTNALSAPHDYADLLAVQDALETYLKPLITGNVTS